MLTRDDLLEVLQKSDRWGTNSQPLDVVRFAELLATLPCSTIRMKASHTFVLTFDRPLTDEEAERLERYENSGLEESPFWPDGRPRTEAYLWWD
jgi:hypothetical protein